MAPDVEKAIALVIERNGKTMAMTLQDNLRNLGAQDVIVTCP